MFVDLSVGERGLGETWVGRLLPGRGFRPGITRVESVLSFVFDPWKLLSAVLSRGVKNILASPSLDTSPQIAPVC